MKRSLVFLLGCLFLASQAAAQAPSPAQMGITPALEPEVLQVLDKTKTWSTLGTINSTTHIFTPVGGGGGSGPGISEADILVTDPTIGMIPGGVDNSPYVANLMAKMGAPTFNNGYDVTFPAVPGYNSTEYYFTKPFLISRSARYHCSGPAGSSTFLMFAPGIDGVIQEGGSLTGDGGIGGGLIDGCYIKSMGKGSGTLNPITPTQVTSAALPADPNGGSIPASTWQVGDGVIIVGGDNGGLSRGVPYTAILAAPPGTSITNVAGTTLTLSAPITQDLGVQRTPKATATFTQTGSNNFNSGDTIHVGSKTYLMWGGAWNGTLSPYTIKLGVDFPASVANLLAAITSGNGEYITYIPAGYGAPDGYRANLELTASYAAGVITFTSLYDSPSANTFPSVYTTTGTAAGTFGGATFTGANDAVSCPAPCPAAALTGQPIYQLPVAQVFKVRTTAGSSTLTVVAGPRLLKPADVIWSDAFPFGTMVWSATGTVGAQTVVVTGPTDSSAPQNATVTHAPGAEGSLWVIPAGLKRRTAAEANGLELWNFPIDMQMACSSGQGLNCDLSRDRDNFHFYSLIGRWVAGNNTASDSSVDEQFAHNYITDIFEGGTLGEQYFNPNTESNEGGSSQWGFLKNCANQNASIVFGGYMTGYQNGGCANTTSIYPGTPGGAFGIQAGPGGSSMGGTNNGIGLGVNAAFGPLVISGGADGLSCVAIDAMGFGAGNYLLGFSVDGCNNPEWEFTWDANNSRLAFWGGVVTTSPVMNFLAPGATGYLANASQAQNTAVQFPWGVILGDSGLVNNYRDSRLLAMNILKPTSNWHLWGDTDINTAALPGGQLTWYYAPAFSTTLSGAVVKGTTTSVTVAACPVTALPTTTLISDTTVAAGTTPQVNLGFQSSCTAGTLTLTTAALNNANSGDTIKFLQVYGAGAISNDPVNPDYTATTIRSGSAANKDITGRITLAGGTATYTLAGVYATPPVCLTADATTPANASSVSESTTVLTFTGTGTDVIKYECVGRN